MARPKNNAGKINPSQTVIEKLFSVIDDSYVSIHNLNQKDGYFKKIINDELALTKGISNNSIIDFSRALSDGIAKPNMDKIQNNESDTSDMMKFIAANSGNIYQMYSERYKNKFIESQDLKFIAKFVPSLAQTVKLALTHIVSSDDLSGGFIRDLDFGRAASEDHITEITNAIEKFEKDNKLLKKLKNNVFKNALITGKHYVYAVPYKKLFFEYNKLLEERAANNGTLKRANESLLYNFDDTNVSIALESTDMSSLSPECSDEFNSENVSKILKEYKEFSPVVECVNYNILFDAFKDMPAFEAAVTKRQRNKNTNMYTTDGTYSLGDKKSPFNIPGTYIKFINAKNIIPLRSLDEVIGYLYIVANNDSRQPTNMSITNTALSSMKKENAMEKISNILATKVAKNFSEKFVATNSNFKKVIADCIMSNGVINTDYKIQFIPVDDMIEFKINEDENGEGVSMLADSLFPAKLLTNIIIKKSLNFVNKSGDKTIAHVRGGRTDISQNNQAMRTIRNMQEANVTFQDMLSNSSTVFHKYAADNTAVIAQSRSGNKLVEFEKMDGQQIDLKTDYETYLENQALIGTGIPPLMIEQVNSADFSKAFSTAHIGFAGIVADWQSDFEEPCTKLYYKIIQNLDISDDLKNAILPVFKFKLPRPRILSSINTNDAIQTAVSAADQFVILKYGDPDEDNRDIIRECKFAIVKELVPFFQWDKMESICKEITMQYKKIKDEVKDADTSSTDDTGEDDGM